MWYESKLSCVEDIFLLTSLSCTFPLNSLTWTSMPLKHIPTWEHRLARKNTQCPHFDSCCRYRYRAWAGLTLSAQRAMGEGHGNFTWRDVQLNVLNPAFLVLKNVANHKHCFQNPQKQMKRNRRSSEKLSEGSKNHPNKQVAVSS